MANYYDPRQMQTVSSSITKRVQDFHNASEAIRLLVIRLSAQWDDPVNQRFSSHYLTEGAEKAKELEEFVRSYADIMHQCSVKFGKAIDDGNSFFNSF